MSERIQMGDSARVRMISRTDNAIRALNGGTLPVFAASVQGLDAGTLVPYDGTPETALLILRRSLAEAGKLRPHLKLVVRLFDKTADELAQKVPMFYQGKKQWEETT